MQSSVQVPLIAALGGGTGLSILLRGLKKFNPGLTAIVNVTDDGGSSGRLREGLGILPPGDLRNCLVALADKEPLMEKVFQYRFKTEDGLDGHNLGNLFLAALSDLLGFEGALDAAANVLAVKGKVVPVTLEKLTLVAAFTDGAEVSGESRITSYRGKIKHLRLEPACSQINKKAEEAILAADLVVVGPGSLYTSILANLLVPGVVDAMQRCKGHKIYICNVMTQPWETEGFTASDHLKVIYEHVKENIFDTVIVNASGGISPAVRAKYAVEGSAPVAPDVEKLHCYGVKVVAADLLSPSELARHDADKLARLVVAEANVKRGNIRIL